MTSVPRRKNHRCRTSTGLRPYNDATVVAHPARLRLACYASPLHQATSVRAHTQATDRATLRDLPAADKLDFVDEPSVDGIRTSSPSVLVQGPFVPLLNLHSPPSLLPRPAPQPSATASLKCQTLRVCAFPRSNQPKGQDFNLPCAVSP
jgi:hypothetical protein